MSAALFGEPFGVVRRHLPLLRRTILDVLRKQHAGHVAGLFWLVLSPLLLMALYAMIYLVVFRVRPVTMTQGEYVLYIFSGLIPFLGFATALGAGTTALSADRNVLLNTVFPAELLPFQVVVAHHVTTAVGLVAVLLVAAGLGKASPAMLLVPVVLALQILFVVGLAWVTSLVSLVVRDIQTVLTFVTLALLVATPIGYTLDMVPSSVQLLVYGNPLAYFVLFFHELVVFERVPAWPVWAGSVVLGLGSFVAGYQVFRRAKLAFFDHA
jgi:lipopolysaccharide transport system permease protein